MLNKERNRGYASKYAERQAEKGLVRSNVWIHRSNIEMHRRAAKKLESPNYKRGN